MKQFILKTDGASLIKKIVGGVAVQKDGNAVAGILIRPIAVLFMMGTFTKAKIEQSRRQCGS
jgi:hypothetical protein